MNSLSLSNFFIAKDRRALTLDVNRELPKHTHQFCGVDFASMFWHVDIIIELGSRSRRHYKCDHSRTPVREKVTLYSQKGILFLHPAIDLLFQS